MNRIRKMHMRSAWAIVFTISYFYYINFSADVYIILKNKRQSFVLLQSTHSGNIWGGKWNCYVTAGNIKEEQRT